MFIFEFNIIYIYIYYLVLCLFLIWTINLTTVDVYDGTPTIVTTWLTIIPKIAIFIFLLELYTQIGVIGGIKSKILSSSGYITTIESLTSLISLWEGASINLEGLVVGLPVLKTLLLISSILSLIIGSLLGLAQIRIKRLLA